MLPFAGEAVTVVICSWSQARAAKMHTPKGTSDYRAGVDFEYRPQEVQGLADLHALWTAIAPLSRAFIVNGRPMVQHGPRRSARRWGAGRTLVEKPIRVFPIDLDSIACPAGVDPCDVHSAGAYARSQLSPELARAACVAQLTGSAGVKPGIRVRLIFWLDRPISLAEAKGWARAQPLACDTSIYTPSQPIYTASPIFTGGRVDPVSGPRIALLAARRAS
jgi:hypothetical protein